MYNLTAFSRTDQREWMMKRTNRLGLLTLALSGLLASGCKDETNGVATNFDLTFENDGGMNPNGMIDLAAQDSPMFAGDGQNDPGGPTIVLVAPLAGEEVHYNTLRVTATITAAAGTLVDADSLELQIPSGSGSVVKSTPMALTPMPNTYYGQIDISDIKGGMTLQAFRVFAKDTMGRGTTLDSTYIHDPGPKLTFLQPVAMSATGAINIDVLVEDETHPVTNIAQVKAGIRALGDVTLSAVAGSVPFRAQGIITFSQYNPALEGLQLINVEVTNSAGTIGRATKQFVVDNGGPSIEITQPLAGEIVGGVMTITAQISDLSGVDDSTVLAIIGGSNTWSVNLTRSAPGSATFSGIFDIRSLGRSYVFPIISVRAGDILGNEGNASIPIIVDNTPPALSMDPPHFRQRLRFNADEITCSVSRDPVGEEAISDGDVVHQLMSVRARIEDLGNLATGQAQEWWSGIDKDSVQFFAVPNTLPPYNGGNPKVVLVVDTDGDGICDDINPALVPSPTVTMPNQAIAVNLVQLNNTGGGPDFRRLPGYLQPVPLPAASFCSNIGNQNTGAPNILCSLGGTMLSQALEQGYGTTSLASVIWSIPPTTGGNPLCGGLQFDSLNRLPEGPTCFAARARDRVGNRNVSAPIRVCVDRGGGACNAWPPAPGNMPDCTGVYDKGTQSVVPNMDCVPAVYNNSDQTFAPAMDTCDGYVYGGYCYKLFTGAQTWDTAQASCDTWGRAGGPTVQPGAGNLVSIVGAPNRAANVPGLFGMPAENAIVKSVAAGHDIWIGTNNASDYMLFSDGERFEQTPDYGWQAGARPNNALPPNDGGEMVAPTQCAYLQSNGLWNFDGCGNTKAFVCKRPFSHHFPARYPAPEVPIEIVN